MSIVKQHVSTELGEIAYAERGRGPSALFVHGVLTSGYLWRHVIEQVADVRTCLAVDLLAHGATRTPADADLTFAAQAQMLERFCDALHLEQVDLVANDSGGAIAQIFAARYPQRIRSLTLTNCDTHDNWPPPAFDATRQLILQGGAAQMVQALLSDLALARTSFAIAYEQPETLSAEALREYLGPFAASLQAIALLERWFAVNEDHRQTVEIEPLLRALSAPTQIVWGTGDPFFALQWAYWLKNTIAGAQRVVELPGAKLLFPEERSQELATALREHWQC